MTQRWGFTAEAKAQTRSPAFLAPDGYLLEREVFPSILLIVEAKLT